MDRATGSHRAHDGFCTDVKVFVSHHARVGDRVYDRKVPHHAIVTHVPNVSPIVTPRPRAQSTDAMRVFPAGWTSCTQRRPSPQETMIPSRTSTTRPGDAAVSSPGTRRGPNNFTSRPLRVVNAPGF